MEKAFNNICRRLANPMRVNLLRTVMASPERDGLPVYQLADLAFMKTPAACQYLIHLEEECGLVESTRAGRYVLYRTRRNVADPDLSRLVRALSSFFRAEGRGACDVNGARAADPAFLRLMPALANATRQRGGVRPSSGRPPRSIPRRRPCVWAKDWLLQVFSGDASRPSRI